VADEAIPLDVVPAHHRPAPPIQQLHAVLQLLDGEKEDGGLHLVVLEHLEVGIVRARRIRQIDIDPYKYKPIWIFGLGLIFFFLVLPRLR
jgi:hypothetical protein